MLTHILCFNYIGQPATSSKTAAGAFSPLENEVVCTEAQAARFGAFVLRNGDLIDIGDKPSPLHYYNGDAWVISSQDAAIELQSIKTHAIEAVSVKHAAMLAQLTGGASIEERDTWQLKLDAATASIAANAPTDSAITMFHAEAEADNCTIMDKCHRAALKGEAYKLLIGIASGIKTRAENGIKAAQTVGDVKAVLLQAGTEAQAAAGQYLQMIGVTS